MLLDELMMTEMIKLIQSNVSHNVILYDAIITFITYLNLFL